MVVWRGGGCEKSPSLAVAWCAYAKKGLFIILFASLIVFIFSTYRGKEFPVDGTRGEEGVDCGKGEAKHRKSPDNTRLFHL